MAYVAVTGGREAIAQANLLVDWARWRGGGPRLDIAGIEGQLGALVHRVMAEGGMYAPSYAALAIKQAQGDTLEAGFLIRAYRSTLPRHHTSTVIEGTSMRVVRRISSAFKDIPGGQMLGATGDYAHRLLDFGLRDEPANGAVRLAAALAVRAGERREGDDPAAWPTYPKVADLLRAEGLVATPPDGPDEKPYDVTREKLTFPVPRSGQLQILARGETGAMMALAYSSLRGFGAVHPTIGELRVGYVELCVVHPLRPAEGPVYAGEILVTEVESINSFARTDGDDRDRAAGPRFELGYGLCFGHNETKAISMSILERAMGAGGQAPAADQEFVLSHVDSVEANGFVSHLKLPHYVTFQSALARIRRARGLHAAGKGVDE